MILVMGSKGGVGATTLACGLVRCANIPIVPVDLGVANDLAGGLAGDGQWALHPLDILARLPESRLDQAIDLALVTRGRPVLALSRQGQLLYAPQVARVLDLAEARQAVIVDAGVRPLPQVLELATAVVLIVTPDPRSHQRAEQFLASNPRLPILPVLNFAPQGMHESAGEDTVPVPDTGSTDPLSDGGWQTSVQGLARQLGLLVEQPAAAQPRKASGPRPARNWRAWLPRVRMVD